MKTIFITAFFLFLVQSVEAQHHLDQTSTWVYYRSVWQGPQTTEYYRTITIDGDSLIQGQTYFKRSIQGVDIVTEFSTPTITPIPKQFFDLVRDDANYFYTYINGQDSMITDFSKSVGDSLFIDGMCADSISQIDTLFLGSTPLKKWTLYSYNILPYIEGVGTINNLELGNHCSITGSLYQLVCYEKQGDQLILNSNINCRVYNSIVDKKIENTDVKVYPNPTSGKVQIDYLPSSENRIEIVSANGKLIFAKEYNRKNISLDMTIYPKGAYFLRIISEDGILTKKMLKM